MRRVLWSLFAFVNALVLGAAALGWAAAYVDPRTLWWGELLAVGLPVFAVLLAVLLVVPLAARRWGWVVVNTAFLMLLAIRLVPFGQMITEVDPAADDLVVMTLNVPRYGASDERLTEDVVGLLAAEQPDFVGLQETGAGRPRRAPYRPVVASYIQPAVDTLGYTLAIPLERSTQQPVLIRSDAAGGLAVVEQSQQTLETGPDDRGASQVVRTRFRWQGREAVHYNLHLRSFGQAKPWEGGLALFRPATWLPFLRRYRTAYHLRATEVEAIREQINAETLPVLVSGDFNATPNNWAYRRLAAGRTDVFRAAGSGWGGTYRADLPLVRIDFVLAGPEWEAVAARVPDVRFSDHRPLVVRLRWRDDGDA